VGMYPIGVGLAAAVAAAAAACVSLQEHQGSSEGYAGAWKHAT
jgi:hypothetical protein